MDPITIGEQIFGIFLRGPVGENIPLYKEMEMRYNQLKGDLQQFVTVHFAVLSKSANEQIRKMAITMLQKELMTKNEEKICLYQKLPNEVKQQFNQTVVSLMNTENSAHVLRGYVTLISKIYDRLYTMNADCSFIMNSVFEWIRSGDENHRSRAFEILNENIIYNQTMQTFCSFLGQYMNIIQYGLQQNDPIWLRDVFKLFVVCACSLEAENEVKQFVSTYPTFLQGFKALLQAPGDQSLVFEMINIFDELFTDCEYIDKSFIVNTIELFIPICMNGNFKEDVRTNAFEVLITITTENVPFLTENMAYIYPIINTIVFWISTVQVTERWLANEDDEDDLPYFSYASAALVRLIDDYGTEFVLRYILMNQEELLTGTWQQRHVYLQFIFRLLGGSKKQIKKNFAQIIQTLLKFTKDESPRNRQLAVVCVNKLTVIDRKNTINYLLHIMNFISASLQDQVPRIVSRTCDFVSSILDNYSKELMQPYYEKLLQQLLMLMQSQQKNIVSESACAVSFIAIKLKEEFIPYYQNTLQILSQVLESIGMNMELLEVKGRIIECLSVIGMELKGDCCIQCASIIFNEVDKVMKLPNIQIENSVFGFVETSFTRIAEILKEKFVQYIPTVLQIVLPRCNINPICSPKDLKANKFDDDDLGEFEVNGNTLTIHTALSEEKRNAINSIGDFANDLEHLFSPFVPQCVEVILPIIEVKYDDDLRSTATKTITRLLKSYYLGKCKETNSEMVARQQVLPVFCNCLQVIFKQLAVEKYVETITKMLVNVRQIVDLLGENTMPIEIISPMFETLTILFKESMSRMIKDERDVLKYQEMRKKKGKSLNEDYEEEMDSIIMEQRRIELALRVEFRRTISLISKTQPNPSTQAFQTILYPVINEAMNIQDVPQIKNLVTMFCDSLLTTFATDTNNPVLINQLTTSFIQRFLQNAGSESVLINLSLLIGFPAAKDKILEVSQICERLFPMKAQNQMMYDTAITVYGKCLVEEPRLCNETVLQNFLSVMPNCEYPDESLSTVLSLIAKNRIPVNFYIIKKVMDMIITIVDHSCIDDITSRTKEMTKYYMNEWSQHHSQEFFTIFNQYDSLKQQAIREMCGMN